MKLLCFFFATLQEVDSESVLIEYKSDPTDDTNFEFLELPITQSVQSPSKLHKSITQLLKFFPNGKPQTKGGQVYTKVHFMHEEEINNMLLDLKELLAEKEVFIYKQSIQH